jgi:hypothetical protein
VILESGGESMRITPLGRRQRQRLADLIEKSAVVVVAGILTATPWTLASRAPHLVALLALVWTVIRLEAAGTGRRGHVDR